MAIGVILLSISLKQADADDTELFVANLPSDAQANVIFIMDTSGSMGGSVGSSTRMEVAKDAARLFVQSAQNINISLMSFNGSQGAKVDFASEDIDTGRQAAINVINGYSAGGLTPLSESLYESYRYLLGGPPRFGDNSVVASRDGANYRSPIVNPCQKSNIVLFTDGQPFYDTDATGDIRNLVNGFTLPSGLSASCGGDGGCMDELAWYMFNQDIRSDLDGDQNATTYTIAGFGGAPPALLTSTANFGGGQYYSASNAQQLNDALTDILLRVNAEDSTFAAPATSTSAFNSLETAEDVYYIVFKPDVGPGWAGNLKRYRLGEDNQIYDANGDLAIDPLTGFFVDTAQSFWSSAPDGKTVGLGGMAEKITQNRSVFTNLSGTVNITLNDTGNRLHESNTGITETMLGVADSTERYEVLRWGRGVDIDDADSDGSTTDDRTSIGDPIHTQPAVITYYKNSTGNVVDKTVFFTTNDGFLHAVNADDGTTEFAYIPRELLTNLKTYRDGYVSGGVLKVYGLDGPMTVWINDSNGDGDVLQSDNGTPDTGDHVYLYLTMRRGGNSIYALDITDRSNPVLKWRIQGDVDDNAQADSSGNFAELGQTWSRPRLAQVNWNGVERKVLFFAGGYDRDADGQTTIGNNDIGRAIYMVDAESGNRLWWAGKSGADLNISNMDYSIPAELTVVDIDQDGNIDYLFAADIGGQVFRIDIKQDNVGASDFATGGLLASIAGSTQADARRFFEAPDVAVGNNSEYLNISIGSGLRPHPLDENVNDRVYVFRDPFVYTTPACYNCIENPLKTEATLYDVTDNLIQQGTDIEQTAALTSLEASSGWYLRLENPGEKLLSRTRIFNGILLFNSFAPRQSTTFTCGPQPGENQFYAVSVETAASVFNLDTVDTASDLNKNDRRQMLKLGTIAPEVSIVTRNDQDGAEICVGTECFQDTLQTIGSVPMIRNFWRENR